jgi:hypothetical protein
MIHLDAPCVQPNNCHGQRPLETARCSVSMTRDVPAERHVRWERREGQEALAYLKMQETRRLSVIQTCQRAIPLDSILELLSPVWGVLGEGLDQRLSRLRYRHFVREEDLFGFGLLTIQLAVTVGVLYYGSAFE